MTTGRANPLGIITSHACTLRGNVSGLLHLAIWVAAQLLERHRDGQRLGFADGDQFVTDFEPGLDPSGWSILKAHNAHERFGELLAQGRALAIYSHRDLRDVAFSWMHKTGASFQEIVDRDFLPLCLHNDWFWRARPGTLLQSYEDLIANPVRGIEEIAAHLGIELEPGEAKGIAEALSLESNRKRTDALSERLQAEGVALDSKDLDHYDRQSLLHWNHLRSGRAGAWREVATPEEKATIARICGHWLAARGYEANNTWAEPLAWEAPGARLPRISYAWNGTDILLDRLFHDQVGTYVDIGADHPTFHNNTFYFYLRDWRGTNLGLARPLFGQNRPDDVNLEWDHSKNLVEHCGPVPPDLFSIRGDEAVEHVLRSIPLASWRPRVLVIEASEPKTSLAHEVWELALREHGYLFATFDGISRIYLRADLADSIRLFDRPINPLDVYATAELVEQRQQAERVGHLLESEHRHSHELQARLAAESADVASLKARLSFELEARHHSYLGWLDERDAWRVEREAWLAERATWLAERETWELERQTEKVERQATQAELHDLQAEFDELATKFEEVEQHHLDLAREVEQLRGELMRLEGEVHTRNLELDQTRSQLGPYLKIDRLGVVSALQRRVHAHRAHASRSRVMQDVCGASAEKLSPAGRTRRMELAPGIYADESGNPVPPVGGED